MLSEQLFVILNSGFHSTAEVDPVLFTIIMAPILFGIFFIQNFLPSIGLDKNPDPVPALVGAAGGTVFGLIVFNLTGLLF